MGRDIDAIKIAGIHETRGRRTKAEKARELAERMKAFAETGKGLARSMDFALPFGLFAFLTWTTRLRIEAVSGPFAFYVNIPGELGTFRSYFVQPTYQGRAIQELHFTHPELYAAEGMGMLSLLMSMPGTDWIGLAENGLALAIYHIALNGGSVPVPGTLKSPTSFAGLDPTVIWSAAFGGIGLAWSFFLGGAVTGTTATQMVFQGLFPSKIWNAAALSSNITAAMTARKIAEPTSALSPTGGAWPIAVDGLVRLEQIDSLIKGLAHAAFLALILKRGGGVVPTE